MQCILVLYDIIVYVTKYYSHECGWQKYIKKDWVYNFYVHDISVMICHYLRNEGRLDGCYGIMTCAVESDIWLCSTIVLHNQMSVNRARHNAITPIQTTLITYIYILHIFTHQLIDNCRFCTITRPTLHTLAEGVNLHNRTACIVRQAHGCSIFSHVIGCTGTGPTRDRPCVLWSYNTQGHLLYL